MVGARRKQTEGGFGRYLDRIGRTPLLGAAGERALAAELDEARAAWAEALVDVPGLLEAVIDALAPTGKLEPGALRGWVDGVFPAAGAVAAASDGATSENGDALGAETAFERVLDLAGALRDESLDEARREAAREWLQRQFAAIRWRPVAVAPLLLPFRTAFGAAREAEAALRQLLRYAGGVDARRLADVPVGGLDERSIAALLTRRGTPPIDTSALRRNIMNRLTRVCRAKRSLISSRVGILPRTILSCEVRS